MAAFPVPFASIGPADWETQYAASPITIPSPTGLASYTLSLEAGNNLSISVEPVTGGVPYLLLYSPSNQLVRMMGGIGTEPAWLSDLLVTQSGDWTLMLTNHAGSGSVLARVTLNASTENFDTSNTVVQDLSSGRRSAGGAHYAVQGLSQLRAGLDTDAYSVDLSSRVGQRVDVILKGLAGVDFAGETLEVVGPNGTTVLRQGVPEPNDWNGDDFDIGVLDFRVPLAGVYKFRVSSHVAGAYLLAIADSLPRDGVSARDKLDFVVSQGLSTLGSTNQLLATISFQEAFERLSTEELLQILINEGYVQGYKTPAALQAALPGRGVRLANLLPDGVITALELAWNGSLLRDANGRALTSIQVRDQLAAEFARAPANLLDRISTEHLLELLDDRITTSPSDVRDELVAYTRRATSGVDANVISAFRVEMLQSDGTIGPVPNGAAAAAIVNQMPVGQRVIYVRDLHYVEGYLDYHIDPKDANGRAYDYYMIWMDQWVRVVRQRYQQFFQQFRNAGGQVDLIMIDFEFKSLAHFEMGADRRVNPNSQPAKTYWEALTSDPRWGAVRDRLIRAGFTAEQLLPANIGNWSSRDIRESIWNAVMEERYHEYFDRAMISPVKALFPNVAIANYAEGYRSHSFPYGSFTRLRQSYHSIGWLTGTHQSPVLYASPGSVETPTGQLNPEVDPKTEIDRIAFTPIVQNGVRTNRGTVTVTLRSAIPSLEVGDVFRIENQRGDWVDPVYTGQYEIEWISPNSRQIRYTLVIDNPNRPPRAYDLTGRTNTTATAWFTQFSSYNGLVGDVMELRSHAATSTEPILPWISSPQFQAVRFNLQYEHYGEGLFHAALAGATDFMLWKWSGFGLDPETDAYVADLLGELNALIGFEDRHTLSHDQISWQDGYVLTGMEAGGRRIWRLTPDPDLPFAQLPGGGARFQIGNRVLEIPGGTVYQPPVSNSPLGVWIIQNTARSYLRQPAASLTAFVDSHFQPDTPPPELQVTGDTLGVRNQSLSFTASLPEGTFPGMQAITYSFDWNDDGIFEQTISGGRSLNVSHIFAAARQTSVRFRASTGTGPDATAVLDVDVRSYLVIADETNPAITHLMYGGTAGNDWIAARRFDADTVGIYSSVEGTLVNPQLIAGVTGGVTVLGGDGNDTISGTHLVGTSVAMTIYGDAGDDQISGSELNDILFGGIGNDTIIGYDGRDGIDGGEGDDWIEGGAGDDLLLGQVGNDSILAGDGRDLVDGGTGSDSIRGGTGEDLLFAGTTIYSLTNRYQDLLWIRDAWAMPVPLATRVALLASESLGIQPLVPRITVIEDNTADEIFGEENSDWLWLANADTSDAKVDDAVTRFATVVNPPPLK
jgi:hypothetical protein